MKHRLGLLLSVPLLLACAACGGAASGGAGDAKGSGGADEGYHVLQLVSGPNAGGVATTQLTWLPDDDASSRFAAQFRGDLQAKLHAALAAPDVPKGQAVFAAVVAVGCDVPTDVTAGYGFNGAVVSAAPVPSPKPNCVVPTTTVAIVSGPTP